MKWWRWMARDNKAAKPRVLLGVIRGLQPNANGARIQECLESMGYSWSLGSIYVIGQRLQDDGLAEVEFRDSRKFWSLTEKGKRETA